MQKSILMILYILHDDDSESGVGRNTRIGDVNTYLQDTSISRNLSVSLGRGAKIRDR